MQDLSKQPPSKTGASKIKYHNVPVTLEELYHGTVKNMTIKGKTVCQCLSKPCKLCKGVGFRRKIFRTIVNIPRGSPSDCILKIKSPKDENTMLHIKLEVVEHETFQLNGFDLICAHQINVSDVFCGTHFDIPHLDGNTYRVQLKPLIDYSKPYEIPGKGMRHCHGGYGRLLINLACDISTVSSDNLRKIQEVFVQDTQAHTLKPITDEIEIVAERQSFSIHEHENQDCIQQ